MSQDAATSCPFCVPTRISYPLSVFPKEKGSMRFGSQRRANYSVTRYVRRDTNDSRSARKDCIALAISQGFVHRRRKKRKPESGKRAKQCDSGECYRVAMSEQHFCGVNRESNRPEAAWRVKASMIYVWMVWKFSTMPAPTTTIPVSGTIQCTLSRADQPVRSSPMGSNTVPGTIDAAPTSVDTYTKKGREARTKSELRLPDPVILRTQMLVDGVNEVCVDLGYD